MSFFSRNDIPYIPENQFAFRPQHSCEDCLCVSITRWLHSMDDDAYCGIVFADMSKAFDRVQHAKLIEELSHLGIGGKVLEWFSSYLSDRVQTVRAGDDLGDPKPCTRGVPQGSVLGPVLFSIYIRQAPGCFQHSTSQLYADDIAFYVTHEDSQVVSHRLNNDLAALDNYLNTKGLVLNPNKTQFVVVRRPGREIPDDLSLSCQGVAIRPVASARYLGVIIDEHLCFRNQVEAVCKAVNQKTGAFKHNRANLNHHAKRTFYLSVIQSTLEYASTAYVHCLAQQQYDLLLKCARIALKKIFGLDRRTPSEILYTHTKICSLEQRLNFKLYVLVYRALHGQSSSLLRDFFTPRAAGPHTAAITRGQATAALVLPPAHTRHGFRAISYLAANRWNALPADCRQAPSPASFRALIKSHLGLPVRRRR